MHLLTYIRNCDGKVRFLVLLYGLTVTCNIERNGMSPIQHKVLITTLVVESNHYDGLPFIWKQDNVPHIIPSSWHSIEP